MMKRVGVVLVQPVVTVEEEELLAHSMRREPGALLWLVCIH